MLCFRHKTLTMSCNTTSEQCLEVWNRSIIILNTWNLDYLLRDYFLPFALASLCLFMSFPLSLSPSLASSRSPTHSCCFLPPLQTLGVCFVEEMFLVALKLKGVFVFNYRRVLKFTPSKTLWRLAFLLMALSFLPLSPLKWITLQTRCILV